MPTTLMNHGVVSQQSNDFSVVYDYEGTPSDEGSSGTVDYWSDDLVITGTAEPVEFTIAVNWACTMTGTGPFDAELDVKINDGGWSQEVNESSSNSGTHYITGVEHGDDVYIRIKAEITGAGDSCTMETTLINGTITRGSGTAIASGTVDFDVSVSL